MTDRIKVVGRLQPSQKQFVVTTGKFFGRFVSDGPVSVWVIVGRDTFLAGIFTGSQEVDIRIAEPFSVSFEREKGVKLYASEVSADQGVESDDVKFTTLDRPPPMSPELRAIQRLAKQNEILREQSMADQRAFNARLVELEAPVKGDTDARNNGTKPASRDDAGTRTDKGAPNKSDAKDASKSGRAAPRAKRVEGSSEASGGADAETEDDASSDEVGSD